MKCLDCGQTESFEVKRPVCEVYHRDGGMETVDVILAGLEVNYTTTQSVFAHVCKNCGFIMYYNENKLEVKKTSFMRLFNESDDQIVNDMYIRITRVCQTNSIDMYTIDCVSGDERFAESSSEISACASMLAVKIFPESTVKGSVLRRAFKERIRMMEFKGEIDIVQ